VQAGADWFVPTKGESPVVLDTSQRCTCKSNCACSQVMCQAQGTSVKVVLAELRGAGTKRALLRQMYAGAQGWVGSCSQCLRHVFPVAHLPALAPTSHAGAASHCWLGRAGALSPRVCAGMGTSLYCSGFIGAMYLVTFYAAKVRASAFW
jgi:hypothetical protein